MVELDRQANDLLEIYANGTLIGRGEIVTVDGRYGVRCVEVVERPMPRCSASIAGADR